MKQDSGIMHSGCTNCCLEILEFLEMDKLPVALLTDAMAALKVFVEPLVRSLPEDATFQRHDVVKKLLEVLPRFRGNSEGNVSDSRFGIEFRTNVSCFVVSILKDFCVAEGCFSDGMSIIMQLLEIVHVNIRNLLLETNRLSNLNTDQSHALVGIPHIEAALLELCDITASLCVGWMIQTS